MLWGDQKTFAIEAEFLHADGKWRFGKLGIWVGGKRRGDFDEAADLASAARWGRTFLASSAQRSRPDFALLDAQAVFFELFEKYLVSTPAEPWNRDAHLLDDVGESSLRDKASLVVFRQQDGTDRIVVRDWREGTTMPTSVPAGLIDETIGDFCLWAERL